VTRPGIAVYSTATAVTGDEVLAAVEACAAQLVDDFCPAWGKLPLEVVYYSDPKAIPEGTPTIVIADVCDDPDALAYHTEQGDGAITGLVGAKTCIDAGESWTSALSHEILETARDPFVDDWVAMPDGRRLVAAEVCDPVQDQGYEHESGIQVSNFVLPAWFDCSPPKGSSFDFLGSLKKPFTRTRGGYFVLQAGGKVTQEGMRAAHRPPGGRGARRAAVKVEPVRKQP
jgi:hypothetical protein